MLGRRRDHLEQEDRVMLLLCCLVTCTRCTAMLPFYLSGGEHTLIEFGSN